MVDNSITKRHFIYLSLSLARYLGCVLVVVCIWCRQCGIGGGIGSGGGSGSGGVYNIILDRS